MPIAPRIAFDGALGEEILTSEARDLYLMNGKIPIPDQMFQSPQQAEVLRRISMDGRAGFYEGEVAENMVASLNAAGGVHTLDDFAATCCNYANPIQGGYGGLDLLKNPPNGQGATAILLLSILRQFDIAAMNP